jgi:hypothetical protein
VNPVRRARAELRRAGRNGLQRSARLDSRILNAACRRFSLVGATCPPDFPEEISAHESTCALVVHCPAGTHRALDVCARRLGSGEPIGWKVLVPGRRGKSLRQPDQACIRQRRSSRFGNTTGASAAGWSVFGLAARTGTPARSPRWARTARRSASPAMMADANKRQPVRADPDNRQVGSWMWVEQADLVALASATLNSSCRNFHPNALLTPTEPP